MSPVDKIKSSFKSIYDKLIGIKDSPQKIALGFGLGVFCGILPGTGPMASVVLAFVFRVNKVAALAGSIFTNTWLSLVTFVLAVKLGSMVTGADWKNVYDRCQAVIRNFNWNEVKSIPFSEILLPLAIGYFLVGLICGMIAYSIAGLVMQQRSRQQR